MVQGWCFHPQLDIENLTVQFAHSTTSLNTRLPRPDVARVFPQFNSASESGFAGHLSLVAGKGPVMLNAKLRNGSLLRQILLPELNIADETLLAAERNACTARARRIRLTAAKQAVVSIIIPIHNQLELTLGCLESIQRNTGETSFEVIVIDDKSEPFVAETLQRIANLRVFTNAENRGFILNCNFGAEKARGEHLVFLNNDTEVSPGWLESLLSVLATKPDAGAVGAKLIFPDGSLQDAGGLIWSDGTCWNYGKGDEPDQPEYNYVRRVDYCTGACVMVRRDLFQKIGGFDERFCPAYYEDVDLAFKIRRQGLHVYFQPDARITHFEGMSSGKSTAGGVKRNQLINQEKFRGKWAAELVHYGDGPYLAELARDRFCNERILVIDACALTPDMDAGSLRMFNLLTILADTGMKVTFAAENLQFHEPFSTELRQAGVEHLGAPHCSNLERHLEEFGFSYDAIIISRKAIAARFLPVARKFAPAAKVIFDTVDLMFLRLDRQADLEKSADLRTQASISKLQELSLARAADLTYVVSEEEASVLSKEVAAEKLAVVPLINPTRIPDTPFEKRWGLLFVGGYQHPPNLDAVLFFLDEILPIVRRSIPEIDVHIVGSRTPPSLSARAGERIHIHGFVADMDPLLDSVRLSIAPLRFGAGVKGKINQSMACGVPVVATNMAIEGMHLTAESDCLVADTPLDFAGAVCRLHQDPSLWQKLSTAGIAHVDRYFSFKRVRSQLANSFQRLGIVGRRKPLELPARPFHEFPLGSGVVCSPDGAAVPFLAAGWDPASSGHHWSVSKKAGLRFKLPVDAGDFRLTAKLFPLLVDNRVARQRIEITAAGSGENAGWDLVQGGVTEINFNFTLEPRHHGIVELEWRFPDAFKPVNFGLSVDERWLAVGLIEFGLTRNSR
jgi:GT2 family glycosyltransferase/glycosyltransferase involved in cell wall biosynthesis